MGAAAEVPVAAAAAAAADVRAAAAGVQGRAVFPPRAEVQAVHMGAVHGATADIVIHRSTTIIIAPDRGITEIEVALSQ